MDEQEFLKAIKMSKEELIEWLNEMHKEEKKLREIILRYEKEFNATVEGEHEVFYEGMPFEKHIFYTKVEVKEDFKYNRKGW